MNWAPILIGLAIICYTFAAYMFLLQVANIYHCITDWRYRDTDNFFIIIRALAVLISLVTIGSVALCYL